MLRYLLLASSVALLSGCVALAEGGLVEAGAAEGLATRAAMADGLAGGSAATSGEAAASGGASFFVDGSVEIPRGGPLGQALSRVAGNSAPLRIVDGVVRAGSQDVATVQGASLYSQGNLVGYLDDGVLVEQGSGARLGRLRGMIPGNGAQLTLTDGTVTRTVRSLFVDILQHSDGGYVVRLASGETATYAGPLTAAALTAIALAQHCDDDRTNGFALRKSGELIPFNTCVEEGDAVSLGGTSEFVVADRRELAGLVYVRDPRDRQVPQPARFDVAPSGTVDGSDAGRTAYQSGPSRPVDTRLIGPDTYSVVASDGRRAIVNERQLEQWVATGRPPSLTS